MEEYSSSSSLRERDGLGLGLRHCKIGWNALLPSGDLRRARRISLARGRGGVKRIGGVRPFPKSRSNSSRECDFTISLAPTGSGRVRSMPLICSEWLRCVLGEDPTPFGVGDRNSAPSGLGDFCLDEVASSGLVWGDFGLDEAAPLGRGDFGLDEAAPLGRGDFGLDEAAPLGRGDFGLVDGPPLGLEGTVTLGLGKGASLSLGIETVIWGNLPPLLFRGSACGFLLLVEGLPSSLKPDDSLPERCSKR